MRSSGGRGAPQVEQRPHDHERQRRLRRVRLVVLGPFQTQQCLSEPQRPVPAAASVFVSLDVRPNRRQETRGGPGRGSEGESAAAQFVFVSGGESLEPRPHVESKSRLRRHPQLLPQSHTETQTCRAVAACRSAQEKRWSGVRRSAQKTLHRRSLRTTQELQFIVRRLGVSASSSKCSALVLFLSAPALAPPLPPNPDSSLDIRAQQGIVGNAVTNEALKQSTSRNMKDVLKQRLEKVNVFDPEDERPRAARTGPERPGPAQSGPERPRPRAYPWRSWFNRRNVWKRICFIRFFKN